jgi:hypothetical protein
MMLNNAKWTARANTLGGVWIEGGVIREIPVIGVRADMRVPFRPVAMMEASVAPLSTKSNENRNQQPRGRIFFMPGSCSPATIIKRAQRSPNSE